MIASKKLIKLHQDNNGRCHYCGKITLLKRPKGMPRKLYQLDEATKDHKVPKISGGLNHIDNYILACFACNNRKGALPYDLFISMLK